MVTKKEAPEKKQPNPRICNVCNGSGRDRMGTSFSKRFWDECQHCKGTGVKQPDNPNCEARPQKFREFTARIISCDNPKKWYANKIGEVFRVAIYEDRVRLVGDPDESFCYKLIALGDLEEVGECSQPTP